ncbi:glutamine amidotransferase [Hyphomonas sp.]|uniref:type 1 glutamine amidotransferase n=1 Tax=Hyphomonas sp. TaxID=87 RepID=UPI001BD151C8|nr:glutamine amidotransferase [Hyphomonas sp.]
MKLTIIETGQAPLAIRDRFPSYPEMFREMFSSVDSGISMETVSVVKGEALPDPAAAGALLYTGSPAGVYDSEPWIAPLMAFIRGAAQALTPQVGICFGHQIMAEALGGKVVKSEKGWGIGRHTYGIAATPGWEGAAPSAMSIAVSHQDQVVVKPASAEIVAASAFTEFAGLSYAGFPALGFQCHPEFSTEFSQALYAARRGTSLTPEAADAAIASLEGACDRRFLAQWIASFLRAASGS